FGVNGKCLLEFFYGIAVTLLEEEDAAELVMNDAIARKLRENALQASGGAVVVAVVFEDTSVEVIGASELRTESEGFLENFARACGVAFLKESASDVCPAIGILRIGIGDFLKRGSGGFEVPLEKQADAVVIPARPVLLRADGSGLRCGSTVRENQ